MKGKANEMKEKRGGAGERRREAIAEAAIGLFLEKGYAAVSVDEIVRKAGGSKSSVYEYFGTKEGLFRNIVTCVAEEILQTAKMPVAKGRTPREALVEIGVAVCSKILNERGIGLFKLAVSNSNRFPKVSRMFYEAGPEYTQKAMAEYLKKEASAGRLDIKDPARAADFFLGMILVKDHIAMPLGCAAAPSRAKIKGMVEDAVDVFMAAYGRKDARRKTTKKQVR